MDKINKDIDICSTSGAKNQNVLYLTHNPLKEEDSYSLNIPFEANIGPMQLQKTQIFLKTNKTSVRKRNKTCDQTQVYEELNEREKKGMNENKVKKLVKKYLISI